MIVRMGYLVIAHVKNIDAARVMASRLPDVGGAFEGARVVGVYRMPDRDEDVCPGISGGCREAGWKRSRRGHMVHACGLRNRGYRAKIAISLMDWFGINLLPRDRTPGVFRNPEGWDKK